MGGGSSIGGSEDLKPNAAPPPEEKPKLPWPTSLGGAFRRHVAAYLAGTVMLAVFQLLMNRIDWLSRSAVNDILGQGPDGPEGAWWPALLMLLFALVAFVARIASRWFVFNAGRDVEYELRASLLDKLHSLGMAFYRKMSSGEIMSRATNDLQQVRLLFGFGVLNMVNVVFAFASAAQIMLTVSPVLTLACMANLPFWSWSRDASRKGLFTRMRANQAALGRMSDVVQANLAGVRVMRSFALEDKERARFEKTNKDYLDASVALARLRGSFGPTMGAAAALGMLIFFWYGGSLAAKGRRTAACRGATSCFLERARPHDLADDRGGLRAGDGAARARRLRAHARSVRRGARGRGRPTARPAHVNGSLAVSGLSFAYGEQKVLDDVAFRAPRGPIAGHRRAHGLGEVDPGDAARAAPPDAGGARCASTATTSASSRVSAVRAAIGYAQQDAFLFSTTVSRNIGFALSDPDGAEDMRRIKRSRARGADVERDRRAARAASTPWSASAACSSPEGRSSASRWLARSCGSPRSWSWTTRCPRSTPRPRRPSSTPSSGRPRERTVMLITHRIAAAARCDSVIVLEQGRVIERGTHEELLRARGLYAAFAEEQRWRPSSRRSTSAGAPGGGGPRGGAMNESAKRDAKPGKATSRAEEELRAFHEEGRHRKGLRLPALQAPVAVRSAPQAPHCRVPRAPRPGDRRDARPPAPQGDVVAPGRGARTSPASPGTARSSRASCCSRSS